MMVTIHRQQVILDTSPLITLCVFKARGQLIFEHMLSGIDFSIVESVAQEGTSNPTHSDSRTIERLLKAGQIARIPNPETRFDASIDGYEKLGKGERDTIRLALTMPDTLVVLDDYLAYVVASRFGIRPVLLLDLIVRLVENDKMSKTLALEIISEIAPRYSIPFVEHTRHKLDEGKS